MVEVQQAVQIALQYVDKLFGGDTAKQLQLEEVELSDDERHWFITIGFNQPVTFEGDFLSEALKSITRPRVERKYKVIDVDAKSGKVRAVKIRQPLERVS
jgi:hypothetical protein